MKRICKLISDYMGVLVLLSAVAALVFPEAIGHLKPKLINPLLGVIMFGMGLTLKAEFKKGLLGGMPKMDNLKIVKLESKKLVLKNDDNQEIPFYDE